MNIEDRILEQRTAEAIRKNLMGQQGKIYLIAKVLGQAITHQSEGGNFLSYDMFTEDVDAIPILADDATSHDVGYTFDGLSRGLNINIICKDYEGEIKLFWDGYCYYHEDNNVLQRYVPNGALEKILDSLYTVVENRIHEEYRKMKKKEIQEAPKLEREEIERLRDKWGDIL
jgi:hypothetical protein